MTSTLRSATPLTLALALALAGGATPLAAQDSGAMTAEEIQDAFQQQKTRGLVIVPSGGGDAAAANQEAAAPAATTAAAPATEIGYTRVEDGPQVNVRIEFDFDSAALRDDQKPALTTVCQAMQSVDVALFQIIGHTDASGSAEYNATLSRLRAEEVKRHLVQDCGISEERLQAIGMGESELIDAEDPRSDENRRVEFQALG